MFNKICKSWLCSSTNFYIGLHPCNSHPGQGIGYLYPLRVSLCPFPINDSSLPNCSVYPSRLVLPVLNVHINGIIQNLLLCVFLFSDSCLNPSLSYADVTGSRVPWPKFSRGYTYPVLWSGVSCFLYWWEPKGPIARYRLSYNSVLRSLSAMETDAFNFLVILELCWWSWSASCH